MFNCKLQKGLIKIPLSLVFVLCLVCVSSATTYNLRADVTTKTMPDGRVITMWGYALEGGTIQVPGPVLTIPPGEGLTINLTNNLPVPTSIVIPGQIATMIPVWDDGSSGPRPSPTSKVRSFTHEAAAKSGTTPGTATYTWTSIKPGTYLYHSGTQPQVQVQMGLYGSAINNVASGEAYAGYNYDRDVILFFSEIDPALHDSVATGNYAGIPAALPPSVPPPPAEPMTSTIKFEPKYFLINGEPFWPGKSAIPDPPIQTGETVLLRFVNAGLKDYSPVIQGQHMTVIAEDGNLYPYPKQHNAVLLPAGKTKDAFITATAEGYVPVYDRRLHLTNATISPGGLLTYLKVASAIQNTLAVTVNTIGGVNGGKVEATSLPGGISCSSDPVGDSIGCTETYNDGTKVALTATPSPGALFMSWTGGDCAGSTNPVCFMTMDASKSVTANFRIITAVTVLTPNGGEVIASGSLFAITWEAPVTAVKFRLDYSINNGRTWVLIANNVTTPSYNWRVPKPRANMPQSLVRVTGYTATGAVQSQDTANAPFAIEVVKVTSPNGGETLTSGTTHTITWANNATTSSVARVRLYYSTNGRTFRVITTVTGNPRSYNWTVPTVAGPMTSSKVRVMLLNASGGNIGVDDSDSVFTIQPAPQ